MRVIVCLLSFVLTVAGQVTVSFSHQPMEAFRAVFGGKLAGVALYDITLHNAGAAPAEVSGGAIVQAAQVRIATMHRGLVEASIARARGRTWQARVLRGVKLAGIGGTALIATQIVAASGPWGLGFAAVALIAEGFSRDQVITPPGSLGIWLEAGSSYQVPGRGSISLLMLGSYVKGVETFQMILP